MDKGTASVVFNCSDFIIAFKPHNLPTVPLKGQVADTLLSRVARQYPMVIDVCGKNPWEGSALHRLDTATEGLVLFALNQQFMNWADEIQKKNMMKKTYRAVSDIPLKNTEKIESQVVSTYFRAFGPGRRMVKAETDPKKADSPVLYSTKVCVESSDSDSTTFRCIITRGFRHQIRVHLSYLGHPIEGDPLYNPDSDKKDLALSCTGLSFPLEDGSLFEFSI